MRLLTVVFFFLLALPAHADAVLGGTGVFKHKERQAYLIYLDWFYAEHDDSDDSPSILLYDVASGDSANMGARKTTTSASGSTVHYKISLSSGCAATVTNDGDGFLVAVGKGSNCADYTSLAGQYSPTWLPPE